MDGKESGWKGKILWFRRTEEPKKKAIDYALDKLIPVIQNVGSQALDQFSTKIRPNKKYKTSLQDKIAYFVSMPLAGPAPTFTTAFGKLGSQALKE